MDFNSLMAKMRELDQPTAPVEECGMEPMNNMAPSMNDQPPPAHPSMSVNLNAQGMDNIESLLKLMTKVNPDMINQKEPAMAPLTPMPSLLPPGPSIGGIGDLGDLDKGPLKMLPNLDKDSHPEPDADNMGGPSDMDADNMGGPEKVISIDLDNDADEHEGPDHEKGETPEFEKGEDEEEKEEEGFQDATTRPGEEYKDIDYMNDKLAGGMNEPKKMVKHSYKQGDNPMAMPEGDLRASIRAELHKRLAEARGAK